MEQAAIGYGVSEALLYCSTSVIYWLISLMLSSAGLFFEFHCSIAFPEQGSHSLESWYEVSDCTVLCISLKDIRTAPSLCDHIPTRGPTNTPSVPP